MVVDQMKRWLVRAVPWSRARRWRRIQYDPRKAPHRELVHDLISAHLPALTLRLRQPAIEDLVLRILRIETTPDALEHDERALEPLLLLISRMQQVIEQMETEQTVARSQFNRFSDTFAQATDPEQQRFLISEYLTNTSGDARVLRGDLKAVRRYLGHDVLRQRNRIERAQLSVGIEVGLSFIGLAGRACLSHSERATRPGLNQFLDQTHADRFLCERMKSTDRWQVRLAACDALLQLYSQSLPGVSAAVSDKNVIDAIERCAHDQDEHPWVQAKALEILLVVVPDRARDVLRARLFTAPPDHVRADFLFRRLAVVLIGQRLWNAGGARLLRRLVERGDPSEHVRMGICEAFTFLPPATALPSLLRIITENNEDSPKVRASAVIALAEVLTAGELPTSEWERVETHLLELLERESHPLVVTTVCHEIPGLSEAFESTDLHRSRTWSRRWIGALRGLAESPSTNPTVTDALIECAEILGRSVDAGRRELASFLAERIAAIPLGGRKKLPWRHMPAGALRIAKDEVALGRTLAELSQHDWGLSARMGRSALTLWRGERRRIRLWRFLHEMRTPSPNKRQGYVHTASRVQRGVLRAPPGLLHEATPTTVPGERTHVEQAGGWARYLPLVDDILDLPILRRRPIRIFSSHGVTTLQPARSLLRRLWNRITISWRYRSLAGLRQFALAAEDDEQRSRYVATLADDLDVEVSFCSYSEARRREDEPDKLPDAARDPEQEPDAVPGSDDNDRDDNDRDDKHTAESRVSPRVRALFARHTPGEPAAFAAVPLTDQLADWWNTNSPYFSSLEENSQAALVVFLSGFFAMFVIWSHWRRRRLDRARNAIPLSIGGWGTRGKSGTERLKAGLFHGLGYQVVAKTTGCEAMFIHSGPGQEPMEVFLYRPYDKATIWEQVELLNLARGVRTDIFLWECMALNPRYVEILQHEWMRDNLVTLTNAYPDHEDVQGPAGADVAEVIARFIPPRSQLITSEVNFLPLFAEICRQRKTELCEVPVRDSHLIADDVLDLFPYSEHPHNIALVARMAEELGIDRHLAIVTMAEHVVPDLGVLKSYGPCKVRGRKLTFINGCSANERTGFMNNWQRLKLGELDADEDPGSLLITVVNNRADRISRSQVFAEILARDVAVDRHVLIGTNLKGLRAYLETAIDAFLADRVPLQDNDLASDAPTTRPLSRLSDEMKRLRIPRPTRDAAMQRLTLYANATGATLPAESDDIMVALGSQLDTLLDPKGDESILVEEVRRELADNKDLDGLIARALGVSSPGGRATTKTDAAEPESDSDSLGDLDKEPGFKPRIVRQESDEPDDEHLSEASSRQPYRDSFQDSAQDTAQDPDAEPETLEPPGRGEVREHFSFALSRMIVRARLEARLRQILDKEPSAPEAVTGFNDDFRSAYRALFQQLIVAVEDPGTSGDQIIDLCARLMPPGTDVTLLGTQNIKGTGLDFVYRWIAIDHVRNLLAQLASDASERRLGALASLGGYQDYGVFGAGLARAHLAMSFSRSASEQEVAARQLTLQRVTEIQREQRAKLGSGGAPVKGNPALLWIESWIDYLDSIARRRESRRIMKDLVNRRISTARAALEMRAIVGRQKGNWLEKALRRKR